MYLLRGISPRLLSILCSKDIGKVIPNFSVLSGFFLILLAILVAIQYIYTDSKHSNPLSRVTPIENIQSIPQYDKEKYKEMILDAAEAVLGSFGFDRTAYSNLKRYNRRKWRWYSELKEQRAKDIETEMI
jgi:hypothetical protein